MLQKLAFVPEELLGIDGSLENTALLFEMAAQNNHLDAMINLVELYSLDIDEVANPERAKYWEDTYKATEEYKKRLDAEYEASYQKWLHAKGSDSVDYASISRRTQEILGNTYGGKAIVGSNTSSGDIWDEIDTANKISEIINDPNYKIW